MSDDWRDEWRAEKEASGLTWDEFKREKFVHVDDIAAAELEAIRDHLSAVESEYRQMKRELHETRVLLESEEFDP